MTIIKSFSVGHGDTFYIKHSSDNFTIIDCHLGDDNADDIIAEMKTASAGKGIRRFISTHPDEDHYGGIELLDAELPINNFYVVKNNAIKESESDSFKHYCKLRDGEQAFYLYKGCSRKWMNQTDDERGAAGIQILWPDTSNKHFKAALAKANEGESYNNMSAVIRYNMKDGASFMWLGDLETQFMEDVFDSIQLEKTTVVFAAHHGRTSGKIPDSWLEKLDPQIIVIGEAASRDLHYYTGYEKITQNNAGDITFELDGDKVHIYTSTPADAAPWVPRAARIDTTLVKAVVRAHRWRDLLESGRHATVRDLAKAECINESYLSRILRLTLLAPAIVQSILEGHQSENLELDGLLGPLPLDWTEQSARLVRK